MNAARFDTVVVGGGISGLTAAWRLHQAGVNVGLIEASEQVGGCTRTERRDGFLLEKGPFNVMVRDPSFEELLGDLAGEVRVVSAAKSARRRYIYRGGRLFAVPSNPLALLTTGLISFGARCRLIRGLFFSRETGSREETIAEAATRRFGREVAETLISAVVSGIWAGDIDKLSLAACFPNVARIDSEVTSLVGYGIRRIFASRERERPPQWRGLVSCDEGLGALTQTLVGRLGDHLLSGWRVGVIDASGDGFRVECCNRRGEEMTVVSSRLVLALSVSQSSRLLTPIAPEAALALASVESASLVVLNLGFRQEQVGHDLNGFGFLVPQNEPDGPPLGVLWADSIFPHHAPPDHRLIRVFLGGARDPQAVDRPDDALLSMTLSTAKPLLGITGDPVLVDICRHRDAIPQYEVGHRERIEQLRRAVAAVPGLYVIGNFLEGVSLNDCVRVAARCAAEIIGMSRGQAPDSIPREPAACGTDLHRRVRATERVEAWLP